MRLCSYTVSVMVLVSLFAASMTSPSQLTYYQQPSLYYQSSASPQQLIYFQYVQPHSSGTYSRLTNAAYDFVASEAIATDDLSVNQQIAEESEVNTISEGNTSSAELETTQDKSTTEIPEANVTIIPESPEDNQVLEDEVTTVADDLSVTETTVEYEPEAVVVPEISEPSDFAVTEDTENDDDEDTAEDNIVAKNAIEETSKSTREQLPAGTFFPLQFKGPTNGAAIAIANSFSTGEGGTATSHAIAYGQPESETSRLKSRLVSRH